MIKFKYNELTPSYREYHFNHHHYKRNLFNPIGIENLPEGEYFVRGKVKDSGCIYIYRNNEWILIQSYNKDNGHRMMSCLRYNLLPQLSEKEWNNVLKIPLKALNKQWRFYVSCYLCKKELQESSLRSRLQLHKYLKDIK